MKLELHSQTEWDTLYMGLIDSICNSKNLMDWEKEILGEIWIRMRDVREKEVIKE